MVLRQTLSLSNNALAEEAGVQVRLPGSQSVACFSVAPENCRLEI